LEAGFYKYLTKPIRVAEFMETMDEALQWAYKSKEMLWMPPAFNGGQIGAQRETAVNQ
jgi:DNA-binding response OmpR family regulator